MTRERSLCLRQLAPVAIAIGLATHVAAEIPAATKRIVFLGDSLSEGAGVKSTEAFPSLIAQKMRERNLPYQVDNAGVGGDTTAGGLRRLDWLQQKTIDILVVELGGNDGLRGIPVATIRSNLQAIIDKARAKNPQVKIVLAGMQMPPNLGPQYREDFQRVFVEVSQANNVAFVPFLLEGVGGIRELNQPDLIHPTAAGHKIIAETVWKILEPLL